MKKKISIYFSFFIFHFSFGQTWLWATNGKDTAKGNGALGGLSVTSDTYGNAILIGGFTESYLLFGTDTLSKPNNCSYCAHGFITKYSPNGKLLWTYSNPILKDSTLAYFYRVTTDLNNNIYVTGYFSDTLILGSDTMASYQEGYNNVFLAKFSPNGKLLWASAPKYYTQCFAEAYGSSTDKRGNVYITGVTDFSIKFGSDSIGAGLFIVKYDSTGNVIWARNSKNGVPIPQSVITDRSDNVYVQGFFQGNVTFGSYSVNIPINSEDIFLVKYDSLGNVLWAKQDSVPSTLSETQAYSMAINSKGHIYIAGAVVDSAYFNIHLLVTPKGATRAFIAEYDTSGNVLSVQEDMQTSTTAGSLAHDIQIDKSDNIYVSGSWDDTLIFGSVKTIVPTLHSFPIFLVKFDSSGNALCSTGLFDGDFAWERLAVDPIREEVYIEGNFIAIDDPHVIGNDSLYGGSGYKYPFIVKWEPCDDSLWNLGTKAIKNEQPQILIYPNPNEGTITIALQNVNEPAQVEVYNILGEKIYQAKINSDKTEINLNEQPQGIYFYRVLTETQGLIGNGKLIIEK